MTTGRATKATSIARPGRSPPASTATASRIDGPKINGPLRQRRAHDEPDRKLDARGHPRGGVQPLAHAGVGEPAGGEEVEQEEAGGLRGHPDRAEHERVVEAAPAGAGEEDGEPQHE